MSSQRSGEWLAEMREALQGVLRQYDCAVCPRCSRVLDENDVDWIGGNTEAGTEYYAVEVECSACHYELRSGGGWGIVDGPEDWANYLDDALAT